MNITKTTRLLNKLLAQATTLTAEHAQATPERKALISVEMAEISVAHQHLLKKKAQYEQAQANNGAIIDRKQNENRVRILKDKAKVVPSLRKKYEPAGLHNTGSMDKKEARQLKAGTSYAQRRFDTIAHMNYVLSNPKDSVGNSLFTSEQRYQARKHLKKMVEAETGYNGSLERISVKNDLRSWNTKGSKAVFAKQKTKGVSQAPKGWNK